MARIDDLQYYLRYVFAVVAIVIIAASFWITHQLVSDLAREEAVKMEIWADATRQLASSDATGNWAFAQEIIAGNTTIPVVLTDSAFHVLSYRNLPSKNFSPEELTKLARQYAAIHEPIVVDMGLDEMQYIYYDNSVLLKSLRYFPLIQLTVVVVFLLMVLAVLLMTKRAEQNKVWVGLSKETAHQLGTPISSLLAWKEMLHEHYPEDKMIPEMGKDIDRLRTIAERFSQIGSKTELERTNITALVEKTAGYMRTRISSRVTLTVEPAETYYCQLNQPLFEWVIENLCKNAVDAMDGVGSIRIALSANEDRIFIDVTDTGKGISKKNLRKIFRPGFTTKRRGWGLGLSLVHRIVTEYHKGKIFVLSSQPQIGTTFRIELQKEKKTSEK